MFVSPIPSKDIYNNSYRPSNTSTLLELLYILLPLFKLHYLYQLATVIYSDLF